MARSLAMILVALAGCAELGVVGVGDGTSISVGKPSGGRIVHGARLPDRGPGFMTRPMWKSRGNRFGTDELVDLITAVARRAAPQLGGIRLVVADLSMRGGGAARLWHRSHQSGRDADLLYFVRDQTGKPVDNDAMRVMRPDGSAVDGSGFTVDVPRVWVLVRELVTAPEAHVQWIFMYEPIAAKVIEHATRLGEPEELVARARKTLKQPGDSAPHNDHMHLRVYCAPTDRAYGCVDIGPLELLAEREAEVVAHANAIAGAFEHPAGPRPPPPGDATAPFAATPAPPVASRADGDLRSLGTLLRTGAYRLDLWRWR